MSYQLIPTAQERPKIFYHLQKISSYTAWNRVLGYYKAWAEIFEKSIIEAADKATSEKPPAFGTDRLIRVLKGLSICEKCVALLRQGDKAPFRYDGVNCFAVADRAPGALSELISRIEIFEVSLDTAAVPYWDEIHARLWDLGGSWSELQSILEKPDANDPAPFIFYPEFRDYYFNGVPNILDDGTVSPPHHFPPHLPEVPDPTEVLLISNGDYVPYSGIYEPVKAEVPKRKLVSLFSKPAFPSGPFEVVGAMNYLVAHSNAPHIGEGRTVLPTTWRLLWRDDRYLDGTIPAEEAGYVFNRPRARTSTSAASAPAANDLVYARSGERTSKAGIWAVQDDLQGRQDFALDEVLPLHQGREVTWVWTQ